MNLYLCVVALHIISIIAWMAGMLYLPRLYVYHVGAKPGGELSETLKVMERKLLRLIINPAMIATWCFGIWLVSIDGPQNLMHEGWFHVKVALLVLMQILHAMFARWRKDFANDRNVHSAKFYRLINEAPMVLIVVIVFLAVVKPF
jgi:putative membrane protein